MADTKQFELVYSRQKSDFVEGRAYANPRFFSRPREGVTKVLLVGDWPAIEAAYKALGVSVERVDASAVTAGVEPIVVKEAKALTPTVPEGERSEVDIPDDWKDMKWFALRGLASKFADAPVLNKADAVAAIEAEISRRASEEVASNGLTRREMNADLSAANVDIDPGLTIEALVALHGQTKAGA
ncbi:MAG TPA: hypothetical protein VFN88_07645 [Caulobacteraceae bacterium]|nr:hypothetical protein [Caulobacteraceae bacterium]